MDRVVCCLPDIEKRELEIPVFVMPHAVYTREFLGSGIPIYLGTNYTKTQDRKDMANIFCY
jgi:hypothetical protein